MDMAHPASIDAHTNDPTTVVGISMPALHITYSTWAEKGDPGRDAMVKDIVNLMDRNKSSLAYVIAPARGAGPHGPSVMHAFTTIGGKLEIAPFAMGPIGHARDDRGRITGFLVRASVARALAAELTDFHGRLDTTTRLPMKLNPAMTLAVADCLPTARRPHRREITMAAASMEREMPGRMPIVACGPDRDGRYALFLVRDEMIIASGVLADEVDETHDTVTVPWPTADTLAQWMDLQAKIAAAGRRH